MKKERNISRGKRFRETKESKRKEPNSLKVKRNKNKKANKLVRILKYILLVILIPLSIILDIVLTISKTIWKVLKPIGKFIWNKILKPTGRFIKKHRKIITKIIIISVIILAIEIAVQSITGSVNNMNNKIDELSNKQLELEIQLQNKTEEYNTELENKNKELEEKNQEIENKNQELEDKDNQINKLQKQVSVTSRGSTIPRQKANTVTASSNEYQQYAHDLCINEYGWSENDFTCLVKLWNRESNWNPNAHNSSSGAHGIPQSLPASKMASEGADYYTNGYTQIRWGLKYIAGRYGTPSAAWVHSESHNWY